MARKGHSFTFPILDVFLKNGYMDESIDSISLERFSKMFFSQYALSGLSSFNSWENAFTFVGQKAKDDKLIIEVYLPYSKD